MELTNEIYESILKLCSEGDALVKKSIFDGAIGKYLGALSLVPHPKTDWEASTWIYTALGDTSYIKRDYISAKNYLYNAMNCPNGITNPFINLRLGESLFELSELDKAKEYLLSAYMIEGYAIFYKENNKYFDVIKNII